MFCLNKYLKNILDSKKLTDLEKQVFFYIVNNISTCLDIGVREIAKANFTSTTTIMRLSSKLGYKGFIDMVYSIAPLVDIYDNNDSETYFSKLNFDFILKYNNESHIEKFIDLIKNSKKSIYIFSTGFSNTIGDYFYKKFSMSGINLLHSNGNDSLGSFFSKIINSDLLIVFSKSGETQIVLNKVHFAESINIPIVSFTNETKNTLSKMSIVNFRIYDPFKADDDNKMPTTYFPNLLMLIEYIYYKFKKED